MLREFFMYKRNGNSFFRTLIYCAIFVFLPLTFGFYYLYKKEIDLIKYLEFMIAQQQKIKVASQIDAEVKEVAAGQFKSKNWLEIQKQVKDTVVQIFTQVNRFNWLDPYKSPDHFESYGSGFFINDEGYIITNYHVVNQSSSVEIQIPSFGRKRFNVEIVGVYPDKDIALLKLSDESFDQIRDELGEIKFLKLGDSDQILRTQEILALGYPLGQERLKSTLGIVSGRERAGFIQITAPLNPGNSGGPSINSVGEVVGINFAGVLEAQNVGYIIPINEVKSSLIDMYKVKLLRRPTLGCIFTVATPEMVKFLGNPPSGGWYIAQVFENTILDKIGVKENDMLYEVNGYKLDLYGELSVPWSEDKISLLDFLNRYKVGDEMHFVIYRNGERKDFQFTLNDDYLPPIRKIYPEYESEFVDYEIIGGMVVMPLTLNHVVLLADKNPDLTKYMRPETHHEPAVLVTSILPDSSAKRSRVLNVGSIIDEVNDTKVSTLQEFRDAVAKSKKGGFLTIKTKDKMFAPLLVDNILKDEDKLAARYFYNKSKLLDKIESA
ncbi:trypsin-like serine protease [Candidatus Dependentiae bacterium]|nr:trypsin-like serine protease [Candidatus Dependentiae bacterium]